MHQRHAWPFQAREDSPSRERERSDAKYGEVLREHSFRAARWADPARAQCNCEEIRRAGSRDRGRNDMRGAHRIQINVRRACRFDEVRRVHMPAAIVVGRTRPRVRGVRLPRAITVLAVRRWRTDRQRGNGARRRAEGAVQHRQNESGGYGPRPAFVRRQHSTRPIIHPGTDPARPAGRSARNRTTVTYSRGD